MNPITKRIYGQLAHLDLAQLDSQEVNKELQHRCELTSETVSNALRELMQSGRVRVKKRKKGLYNVSKHFIINDE